MTAIAANHLAPRAPQPLLPALARFGIAVAVGVALTAVWIEAGTESHHSVDATSIAISPPNVRFVKLPDVQIIGTRTAKPRAA